MRTITGFMMTQMTAKAGIKKHGEAAVRALYSEFLQLHNQMVFKGKDARKLTKQQKSNALRAISVIKEKRNGDLKGRTVADGSKQRSLYEKHETASPTASTDSLLLSLIVDAHEGRDTATADVTGAYLNASMDDFTLLKVEGESVDILCSISKTYEEFVTHEKGKKVLYLQLLKALYGCVKSALLWYELFAGTLKEMGFVLNPYDPCVANKTINGKQCTILWYVDDNKISHVEPAVVDAIILEIEKRFGKMTVTRGKVHTFLGMNVTFNDNRTVSIGMKEYIQEAINEFEGDIKGTATSPAKANLFESSQGSPCLDQKRKENFHSIVAKLLYACKRSRLDIQLSVAYLCTRVSKSTEEDWGKLKRVLEYLNGTLDEHLTPDTRSR
jgi:uncharacterized protein YeaC (DUF1315 family)